MRADTIRGMHGWSLSLGRYFGVELRLHALFVLLLPVTVMISAASNGSGFRGFALWTILLAAVLVRETARGIASTAAGIPIGRLVLLPTGAAPAMDIDEGKMAPAAERLVALAGPLANFFAGIAMALLMYSATSQINLFERPWFGPSHLLRASIWAQVLLGGLNLLPAFPLDAGVLLRRQFQMVRGTSAGTRTAAGISQSIAILLVLLGAGMSNAWVVIMGCCILLTSRSEVKTAFASSAAETVTVAEVMLREFTSLSASDTLQDAVQLTVPSLQDVFPVVRGPMLVGAISRDTLLLALRRDGNGYVQSAMTRTLEAAAQGDLLMPLLRRAQRTRGAQLLPVMHNDRVVGILTPGNLAKSMALLGQSRRVQNQAEKRA